ncbi:MAG: pitrilysin family protein [Eubacteriales bacterium]|nr:pitrilysin family protein [Eubacteriales bacterium]
MNMIKSDYPGIGETIYSGELPNGLRISVIPKPGFSSYYAVFGTNYGGAMRKFEVDGIVTDTPAGVAHFLEHKMFDMPSGENALSVFSENGASPNAFTSSSYTCYYFKCTDGFEANLRLLLQFVSTPYFTPETVAKEQGIIGQEILMGEDSPGSEIYYNLLSLLYKNHPIRDKIAGTIESIAQISDKTLYDCHKIFYAPSNMVLCIEGDVDPEAVFNIALEELSKEKRSIPHADFGEPEDDLPSSPRKEVQMPVSEPMFLVGCKNIMMSDKKGPDDLRERMISSIALRLLAGQSSPFFSRLYSKGIITNSIDAECDYAAGTSTVMIGAEGPDPDLFLQELNAEISGIASTGFDKGFFERTLKSAIGGHLKGFEDFDETCVNLCLGLLDGFNCLDAYDLLKTLTKEECERWITANLSPERLAMSVVSPLRQ